MDGAETERRKDRDDATMQGPDDPYDAETRECKGQRLDGERTGAARSGWLMDGKVLVDGNFGKNKEEEKRKLAERCG